MATTTVRLNEEDEQLLDLLAKEHGGRSGAIRVAIREMAARLRHEREFGAFVAEWVGEPDPSDLEQVAPYFDS